MDSACVPTPRSNFCEPICRLPPSTVLFRRGVFQPHIISLTDSSSSHTRASAYAAPVKSAAIAATAMFIFKCTFFMY